MAGWHVAGDTLETHTGTTAPPKHSVARWLGDVTCFVSFAELARTALDSRPLGRLAVRADGHDGDEALAVEVDEYRDGILRVVGVELPSPGPAQAPPVYAELYLAVEGFAGPGPAEGDIGLVLNGVLAAAGEGAVGLLIRHATVHTALVPHAWVTGDEIAAAAPDPVLAITAEVVARLNAAHRSDLARLAGMLTDAPAHSGVRAMFVDRHGLLVELEDSGCVARFRLAAMPASPQPDAVVDAVCGLAGCVG